MGKGRAMLLWNDSYSVGVKEIDGQHKKLVEILNELVGFITGYSADRSKDIEMTLAKISEYKTLHFATEEKYFKQFNFEGAEEHVQKHQDFNRRIEELVTALHKTKGVEELYELVDFMEDWFADHLLNMDQKYVKCFRENGLK